MHLRPNNPAARQDNLPPLPPNKTVVEVMATTCDISTTVRKYIFRIRTLAGLRCGSLWRIMSAAGPDAAAAILGGLVSNEDAGARIRFVTEGEASLHFCVRHGLFVQSGGGVLIVDAGGGQSISAPTQRNRALNMRRSLQLNVSQDHLLMSIREYPKCRPSNGSITVTQNAYMFIRDLLEDSKYADVVDHITECFDKSTKLRFKGADEPAFIKFGTPKDRDVDLGIRSGQLRLKGVDVASFFDPSVQCIIQAIVEMRQASLEPISRIFLVGGFGASDYLFSKLKQALERLGLDFCRPDTHLMIWNTVIRSKAVADGAISFYTDHIVSVRVSKRIYGCECYIIYDPNDAGHMLRVSRKYIDPSTGEARLDGSFSIILPKNEQVSENKEFRRSYFFPGPAEKPSAQFTIAIVIFCYRGHDSNPQWLDVDSVQRTSSVKKYYGVKVSIILAFGLAELQAQVAWEEGGEEKRGPAEIMYDDI
ncbi:hypothetical protein BD779DRAFT_1472549 [Infundibulicybe gibba]|nr:hypothetical protein BD779DRAFT_1472549 [Infundibulicybe gibba]